METLWQDLKFGGRILKKGRGFTLAGADRRIGKDRGPLLTAL
jgi:hypothetical protein